MCVCVCVCVCVYLRLMMKTAADISSKIPTPLTDSSRKAEFTPSPIRGKGSIREGHKSRRSTKVVNGIIKLQHIVENPPKVIVTIPELVENSKGVLNSPYPAAVRARTWNTYTVRGLRPVTSTLREKVLIMR